MKCDLREEMGPLVTRHQQRLRHLCVGAGSLAICTFAGAAQCTVSTTSVAFGAYDAFSNSPADITGTVTVSCDASATYSMAIDTGGSGSFNRKMSSGVNQLAYNVFTESTRNVVWGDGTGGTSRMSGSGTGGNHIVYGRVPARQNVRSGNYADSLIVTVEF
jgi:spore coat protein U-like protein